MSPETEAKLKPHQVAPARHLLSVLTNSNAVDLSDTGTGKTFVACAVAATLARPTLVVAPKIVLTAWKRAAEHFSDTISVVNYEKVRLGTTPFGYWTNPKPKGWCEFTYKCQSCQCPVDLHTVSRCCVHAEGIHCLITKKVKWDYGQFIWSPEVKLLVFDEAHRLSGLNSLNEELALAARRQGIRTLCLSATIAGGPLQMRALGTLLDLFPQNGFYSWCRRHGCGKLAALPGFRWLLGADKQREVMARIRDTIIPGKGVAVSAAAVPGFPDREICCGLYDIGSPEQIDKLYEEMCEPLAQLEEMAQADVSADSPLTKILRARQKIELLKVPLAIELGEDFLSKGLSVVWFCNFKQTLDEIRSRARVECFIDGSNRPGERETMLDKFQRNECRTLVAQAESGGVGISLHDLHGVPRVGIVFPSYNAVSLRQVLGRLHRTGAKSKAFYKILFCAGTVEERIHRVLSAKLNNLDSLNSADLFPENLALSK